MSTASFQISLITPEAKLLSQPAHSAILPAHDGQLGILNKRAPIVTSLGMGELKLHLAPEGDEKGGHRSYFIDGGFAQMVNNTLTILAKDAVGVEHIVEEDVKAELAEAQARTTGGLDKEEANRVKHDRAKASAKLRLAREFKTRGGAI